MKKILLICIVLFGCASQPSPETPCEKRERLYQRRIDIAIVEYIRHPSWTMVELMAEVEYQEYLQSKR